ncbi:MAG: hypothetical protein CVU71_13615 [Deltaproteobacteria bacterium HGW-Deltaproteobacteria-6]|jgi:hypothetical protein|nr:MAG: hypothetical protein CVU71_13615 [Deltaproteobacteria bacterium HGW-Deltaproteobacteria-6]PKN96582.1 MAG: hypothetical protein CVU43_19970 [Chloroflexi bacterium HGW-Chloroflexi-5]
MKKKIGMLSVMLGALFLLALLISFDAKLSFAAGPPEVSLQVIGTEGDRLLAATFVHPVMDPMTDFVRSVEIYVNGSFHSVYTYNRQPGKKTFTYYYYDLPLEKGYTIEVRADDTMGHGGKAAKIVVP